MLNLSKSPKDYFNPISYREVGSKMNDLKVDVCSKVTQVKAASNKTLMLNRWHHKSKC